MVIALGGLPTTRAAWFAAEPGTYVDLDCFGPLAQSGTRINKAGKVVTRIEQNPSLLSDPLVAAAIRDTNPSFDFSDPPTAYSGEREHRFWSNVNT